MAKRNTSLSQPTYEYLRDLILAKEILPGERIPENKISEKFGISRTPVRDAMRQLANEGLITIYPNRFAQVSEYSSDEIVQIGTLRLSLETLAIKLAMLFGSRADFLELKEIAEKCETAYNSSDIAKRIAYDTDFHTKLAEISKNALLIKFQKELYLRVQFIILHYPNSINNEQKYIGQHVKLADAMLAHDEEKAINLIVDHLSSFYDLKERYPDNFFSFLKLSSS